MYTLAREAGTKRFLLHHAPALAFSMVVAELFFKWHSFTLECLGFLVTWTLLDVIVSTAMPVRA